MGDEIRNQNVAAVWLDGDTWRARLGPEGQGLEVRSATAALALLRLGCLAQTKGWPFDPNFEPRPEPTFHDA
jgi:hypothetical protein